VVQRDGADLQQLLRLWMRHHRRHHRLNTPVLRNGLLATLVALGQGLQAARRALDQLDLLGEVGTGQRCDNRLHALCVQYDGLATPATETSTRAQSACVVSARGEGSGGAHFCLGSMMRNQSTMQPAVCSS